MSPGCEGFLTDFEFATVPPGLEFEETERVSPITMPGGGSAEVKDRIRWYTMPKDRRGAPMTVCLMSMHLLYRQNLHFRLGNTTIHGNSSS